MNFISRIIFGIKLNFRSFLGTIIAVYGIGWTLLEPILAMIPESIPSLTGQSRFGLLLASSITIACIRASQPKSLNFHFQNNNIEVIFGDLFDQQGILIVPVSRYMHEVDVIPSSLQAMVINEIVRSSEGEQGFRDYKKILDEALKAESYKPNTRSLERGIEKEYPIGTTASINHEAHKYLFFAVTNTELKGYISQDNCSLSQLWDALDAMWPQAKIESRGKDLNIPLLGGGVTGISLEPNRLLEINILSIITAIVKNGKLTTGKIRIVLHPNYFGRINLLDYSRIWDN